MTLAAFSHGGTSPPRLAEKLAGNPLERRELAAVLAYVLRRSVAETRDVDARWNGYYQIDSMVLGSAGSGVESQQLQLLQDILDQLKFKITLPQTTSIATAVATEREALDSIPQGSTAPITLQADFAPITKPFYLEVSGRNYQVTVRPVSARPSLNHVPPDAMARYLRQLGMAKNRAEDLAAIIADWRGDPAKSRLSQSSQSSYQAQPIPYARRDAPIKSWGELVFLQDVTAGDLAFLKSHFVLHGTGSFVHPDFLDAALLAALSGLTERQVSDALALLHAAGDGHETRSLDDVIGASAAKKFETAVSDQTAVGSPIIVTVESLGQTSKQASGNTPGQAMSVVFDPKKHIILESLD